MTNMKHITESIGTLLAHKLPGFMFKMRESCLFRPSKAGWQAVAIEVLPSVSHGIGKLAAHARIRIETLEEIYTPHHPFLKTKDAKLHATLAVNCDCLFKDKALAHGFYLDAASIASFAEAYSAAVESEVLPWLERYSDEEAIYEGLLDRDPRKWITSDRLTRFPVLMAILARRGDVSTFDAIAAEFQEWCKEKHAMVYAPLATAMLKLRPTAGDD